MQVSITRSDTALDLIMDCDGVLLDWLDGFLRYASARLGRKLDRSQATDFNMAKWLGISGDECQSLIADFNAGDGGYFGTLAPLPGAVEALRAAYLQGRRLIIITACSTIPAVIAARKQNLINVFGDIFSEIHCVELNGCKKSLLGSYDRAIWVEDKYENAVLGAACGHRAYLVSTPYNIRKQDGPHDHPIHVVDDWHGITHREALH